MVLRLVSSIHRFRLSNTSAYNVEDRDEEGRLGTDKSVGGGRRRSVERMLIVVEGW